MNSPLRFDSVSTTTASAVPVNRRVKPDGADDSAGSAELSFVARLSSELQVVETRAEGLDDLVRACLAVICRGNTIHGACAFRREEGGDLKACFATDGFAPDEVEAALLPRLSQNLANSTPVVARAGEISYVAVPTRLRELPALVASCSTDSTNVTLCLGQLQWLVTFLDSASSRRRVAETDGELRVTAAALELVQSMHAAATVSEACQTLVTKWQTDLHCQQVFVGLLGGRATCKLVAVSGTSEIDANTELASEMRSVLNESVTRGEFSSWPPLPGQRPDQLLAHQSLSRGRTVMSVPLVTRGGETVGALAVVAARENAIFKAMPGMIRALSEPLGDAIQTVQQNQRSWLNRSTRNVFKRKHRARLLGIIVGACASIAALASPVTHRVRGQVVIEPVERRFCVAPYDGLLETTFVEPGTEVVAGQSLARMDGRELHWELAGVQAERERAEKKRESHVANYETSQALMADLEARTLANRQSLLEFNQSRLEMVSAIDGIVLSGSLDRRENYPVSKGQVVYEIAPLNTLQVEVGVPAEDIQHVRVGEPIELYLEGFGTEPIRAVVQRIRPRAEVREDDNVFVVESKIDNPDRAVRPGMKGTAKIDCEPRSVAWILFHRAAEKLRASLPF